MAGGGRRTQFDELEDEVLRWCTEWDDADEAVYVAAKTSMLELAELKLELEELRTRLHTGGREPKRRQRTHAAHHLRLLEDWFGVPADPIDGVEQETPNA